MVDEILNSLLKEYSQKKLQAELDLEKKEKKNYIIQFLDYDKLKMI